MFRDAYPFFTAFSRVSFFFLSQNVQEWTHLRDTDNPSRLDLIFTKSENEIDNITAHLEPLKTFILPGGSREIEPKRGGARCRAALPSGTRNDARVEDHPSSGSGFPVRPRSS